MRRSDFAFELPPHLIAQEPLPERGASRLLEISPGDACPVDRYFADLPGLLAPGDVLVLNDTRVIKARLAGAKATGARLEILIERVLDHRRCQALVRCSRSPRTGTLINLDSGSQALVRGRHGEFFELELLDPGAAVSDTRRQVPGPMQTSSVTPDTAPDTAPDTMPGRTPGRGPASGVPGSCAEACGGAGDWWAVMEAAGELPLPPYIERAAEGFDHERYQTVFARQAGAVAAPTAGLHFDPDLLRRLVERGVEVAYLTLHVGAGTFTPVRAEQVEDHQMHAERVVLPLATCASINAARRRGGRVIAVGTTCVRALESAARQGSGSGSDSGGHSGNGSAAMSATGRERNDTPRQFAAAPGVWPGEVEPFSGETDIFIYPGFEFRVVDCMITNFHLPHSTLLMLVCAFAGYTHVLRAYEHAVAAGYRFFSYGDASFLHRAPTASAGGGPHGLARGS